MISVGLWHLLQIFTCFLLLTQSFSKDDRKTYIVYMGDYPKGVGFAESLHTSMVESVLGRNFAPDTLLHSYKSLNGFVARLTKEEAKRMTGMDSVVSVIRDRNHKPQTTRSWDFLGFPENVQRNIIAESNTIVGVIDSGIWLESDSFNDAGFGPPPKKWKGICQNFTCNNKIIGAQYFRTNGFFDKDDIKSPIDTTGHGTHCASTAAGNPVRSASVLGLGSGTARGGVPSARIAVYKVCWTKSCNTADILKAYDAAIADGVDILSVSVGATQVTQDKYFRDVHAIGAFHAMKKGILTSTSADNLGQLGPYTTSKLAPWLLTVAASTIDKKFFTKIQLGNGKIYEGVSVNAFDLLNKQYPLIYAGDASIIKGNSSNARFCQENVLDKALVKGKILLCDDIPYPTFVGFAQGAVGVIIRSNVSLAVSDVFPLPAVHINQNDGTQIYSYLKTSTSNPTATIFRSHEGKDPSAPYIDSFSSRGPNKITPNILKPDLAAPGVNILAAWSPIASISGVTGDKRISKYNIQYGTSMACPHVTAAAVYIKSFNPNWSPAVIKSALMTTATPMRDVLKIGNAEFGYGAGQINPIKAVKPGLVYDATEIDYVKFLCGDGYSGFMDKITGDKTTCTPTNTGNVLDLNLPSFALSTTRSKYINATFSRTVTNVGSAKSRYKATITTLPSSSSLNIKVVPDVLVFSSLEEKMSFTLKIEGSINNANIVSSSLVWDDGTFQVRSPVVVYVPP